MNLNDAPKGYEGFDKKEDIMKIGTKAIMMRQSWIIIFLYIAE